MIWQRQRARVARLAELTSARAVENRQLRAEMKRWAEGTFESPAMLAWCAIAGAWWGLRKPRDDALRQAGRAVMGVANAWWLWRRIQRHTAYLPEILSPNPFPANPERAGIRRNPR